MKRSEMLEIMWEFIQEVESDYDLYLKKNDVGLLLDKMQAAGMLSPPNKMIFPYNSPEYLVGAKAFVDCCKWEDETSAANDTTSGSGIDPTKHWRPS